MLTFLGFLLTVTIIIFIILGLIYFINIPTNDYEKHSAYECGFEPFGDARSFFDIHFYTIGLLFIIFDLEIVFLIPFSTDIESTLDFEYLNFLAFIAILLVGFYYEWALGLLNWVPVKHFKLPIVPSTKSFPLRNGLTNARYQAIVLFSTATNGAVLPKGTVSVTTTKTFLGVSYDSWWWIGVTTAVIIAIVLAVYLGGSSDEDDTAQSTPIGPQPGTIMSEEERTYYVNMAMNRLRDAYAEGNLPVLPNPPLSKNDFAVNQNTQNYKLAQAQLWTKPVPADARPVSPGLEHHQSFGNPGLRGSNTSLMSNLPATPVDTQTSLSDYACLEPVNPLTLITKALWSTEVDNAVIGNYPSDLSLIDLESSAIYLSPFLLALYCLGCCAPVIIQLINTLYTVYQFSPAADWYTKSLRS